MSNYPQKYPILFSALATTSTENQEGERSSNESKSKRTVKSSLTLWQHIYPWLICSLALFFSFYEYLIRILPSSMSTQIMEHYKITASGYGNLSAFYYYAYSPMQLLAGVLVDRYGPGRLLALASLVCGLGVYFFCFSDNLLLGQLGRFLMGFGSAFAFVGGLKLAILYLPSSSFTFFTSILISLGYIGGIGGQIFLTYLIEKTDWKCICYLAAVIGLILAFIKSKYIWSSTSPKLVNKAQISKVTLNWKQMFFELKNITKNPQVWLCGIIGCLLYLPTSVFAELWGIPFLKTSYNFSEAQAGQAISMIFLGWIIGGPIMGVLFSKLNKPRRFMVMNAIIAIFFLIMVLFFQQIIGKYVSLLLFGFGFFTSIQLSLYLIIKKVAHTEAKALSLSLVNMTVMTGAIFFQPLVGWILDLFWNGLTAESIRIYSTASYQFALSFLVLAFLFGILLIPFLKIEKA